MNLLNLLLKSLLTDSSVSAMAKKTGLSSSVLKKLIPLAIPLLIKFMTSNASSQSGAQSLLSALTQHTSQRTLAEQIDDADTVDGSKIIGHIFGKQSDNAINSLAQQSGISSQEVSSALSAMAPALMSGLSGAANTASSAAKVDLSDGVDLSDLMAMFGGAQAQSQPSAGGLLSGLLGGNSLGGSGLGGGLLGSLLGGGAQQAEKDSAINGTELLSLLSALK